MIYMSEDCRKILIQDGWFPERYMNISEYID